MSEAPSSSSSSPAEAYNLSTLERVEYGTMAATSALLLVFAVFQLVRIHARAYSLRGQPRRRSFAAKRLFHGFLAAAMLLKLADNVFVVGSPCWTTPGVAEEWWCWPVDASLRRTNALLLFVAYFVTLVFWAEFVYDLKSGTTSNDFFRKYRKWHVAGAALLGALSLAYVLAVFLLRHSPDAQRNVDFASMYVVGTCYLVAGIGIVWKGSDVTRYVRRMQNLQQGDTRHLVLKIFLLVLGCSVLLLFRSLWAMVLGAIAVWKTVQLSPLLVLALHFSCEVVPCICMAILMWPLPPSPHRRPSKVRYERIPPS